MDYRIELIFVPVSDADRAKEFYEGRLGWNVDHDYTVQPGLRVRAGDAAGVGVLDRVRGGDLRG